MPYSAFISYSHAADGKLAPALQLGLHRFAKSWFQLRALRLFRDRTSLTVNPALWPSIQSALSESAYFILLASPQSASSEWVQKEVDWWLANRAADKLLIVLTDGELAWNPTRNCFQPEKTTALPSTLTGACKDEPLWLDLRWARTEEQLSLNNPRFRDAIADLAAPLHGRPKDELVGEDVRQHRRARKLASSAVLVLSVLCAVAVWQAIVATRQKQRAVYQRTIAVARQLTTQAQFLENEQPHRLELSILLLIEALRRYGQYGQYSLEANQLLNNALARLPSLRRRMQHDRSVNDIIFGPGGRLIASASDDGSARLWDVGNGQEIFRLDHAAPVAEVRFSPDGSLLATKSSNAVLVWDVETGQCLVRLAHANPGRAIAFSPDGNFLATVEKVGSGSFFDPDEHSVRIFEMPSGKLKALLPHNSPIHDLAFSPDGRSLATASGRKKEAPGGPFGFTPLDGSSSFKGPLSSVLETVKDDFVRLWDFANARETARMAHSDVVSRLRFAPPDGKKLATASHAIVDLWDTDSRTRSFELVHKNLVQLLAFHPNGMILASSSGDPVPENREDTAHVWSLAERREIARMRHRDWIVALAFSPDGRHLATASLDATARVWDAFRGRELFRMTHDDAVHAVVFDPDGATLATASADHTVKLWQLHDSDEAYRFDSWHGIEKFAFSPDEKYLAIAGAFDVRVMETASHREMYRLDDYQFVTAVTFFPDNRHFVVASRNQMDASRISIARVADGKPTMEITVQGEVSSLAVNPDGKRLAIGGNDAATVWNLETALQTRLLKHPAAVLDVAFGPRGEILATGAADGIARIWHVSNGQERQVVSHEDAVNSVAVSPNGRFLVTASSDHTTRVWSVSSGKELRRLAHPQAVMDAAISPDGAFVATAASDRAVRLWTMAQGEEIARLPQDGTADQIAFCQRGRYIATAPRPFGGPSSTVYLSLWRPEDLIARACSRLTRSLTRKQWEHYLGNEPYRKTCPKVGEQPEK